MNHNVCLSVCRKKFVRILKMSEFYVNVAFFYFLKPPPLKQTRNKFDRERGGGVA